ncbi:MAG: phosphodiester glycosidase family protein, partial [Actinomycetota bacterium]
PTTTITVAPTTTTTVPPTLPPTTTTVPLPQMPAPLATYFAQPLANEGQWSVAAKAAGFDAMWTTTFRPLPNNPGRIATVVVIDQTHLRVGMFNGSDQPGDKGWARGSKVPRELYSSLVAVMNGGFRFEHMDGGYMTEGKVVKELKYGRATLAVDRAGHLHVGELGRDLYNDGSWLTLRQNLTLIVDDGRPAIEQSKLQHTFWGADDKNETFVNRSAVCERRDGRFAYVEAGFVEAPQLAETMVKIGCVTGMQLDINYAWPTFLIYEHGPDGSLIPHKVDPRMNISASRYVEDSPKEFFAYFDKSLVPQESVLDA